MIKVYCYSRCTTCKKALKWLDDNGVKYELLDIKTQHPDEKTLRKYYKMSGLPLKAAVLHVHVSVQMIVRLPLFYQVIETGKASVRQIRQITAAGTRRVCQQDPDRRIRGDPVLAQLPVRG